MNRTHAFAKDFCNWLNDTRSSNYRWIPDENLIGKGHESVDIVGRPKKSGAKVVLVEVELRKDAPLTNVVKVWRWIEEKQFKERFIFVQAFSRYYREGDTKCKNAEFLGRRMQNATGNAYIPMSFEYNPYKHGKQGAGCRRNHAHTLADRVLRKLQAEK